MVSRTRGGVAFWRADDRRLDFGRGGSEMTERNTQIFASLLAYIAAAGLACLALFVISRADQTTIEHRVEHDNCLHGATNGLEIKRCR